MPAKVQIDIEALLDWAYRLQRVDKQIAAFSPRGPNISPSASVAQLLTLGTRIDNSGFAARALSIRLPDDASIVHDAVLSLGDMWLEWSDLDQVEIWDKERMEREHQIIEKVSGAWWRYPIHWANPQGKAPVRVEQACTAALIIIHARAGTRPECYDDWAGPVSGKAPRKPRGECVSIDEVMHARAVYLVWREALAFLAAELDGALREFDVTGPDALAEPWQSARKNVLECVIAETEKRRKPLKRKRNKRA
jgi:hypothetical protein